MKVCLIDHWIALDTINHLTIAIRVIHLRSETHLVHDELWRSGHLEYEADWKGDRP